MIVRKSLLAQGLLHSRTPSILNWNLHADSQPIASIYNTPAVWPIYMHGLVLKYYIRQGGMSWLQARTARRMRAIYRLIDESNGYYYNGVAPSQRSTMSVPILIGGDSAHRRRDLEKKFVVEATKQGLIQLFGHPVRGGLRVTLYHGISDSSVDALVRFMHHFRDQNSV